ncbi:MAG: divalent-cation tolerance protein CutA [Candidatus Omnitrophota bacterium]|jgi:periplasmic divalent cation tolerance protein
MYRVILVTAANKKEARRIAKALINNKLAACVNIISEVESLFYWKGKIDSAKETLLIIKSRKEKVPKIIKLVKSIHSYEIPEIISLPIAAGFRLYLKWIDESLAF